MNTPTARPPYANGLYLAVVQFCLALGWVVYAAYLPQLAQRSGIALRWVPWLLLAQWSQTLGCSRWPDDRLRHRHRHRQRLHPLLRLSLAIWVALLSLPGRTWLTTPCSLWLMRASAYP